jgi:hypothetical protein
MVRSCGMARSASMVLSTDLARSPPLALSLLMAPVQYITRVTMDTMDTRAVVGPSVLPSLAMPGRPKYPRLSVELVTADEQELPWRLKRIAVERRQSLREAVLEALTDWLKKAERDVKER